MSRPKVRRLSERRQVTTLYEAMSEAIAYCGGTATVHEVVAFVDKYYAFRLWKESSMRSYFWFMSKPQRFVRTSRGTYKNTQAVMREIADQLRISYRSAA